MHATSSGFAATRSCGGRLSGARPRSRCRRLDGWRGLARRRLLVRLLLRGEGVSFQRMKTWGDLGRPGRPVLSRSADTSSGETGTPIRSTGWSRTRRTWGTRRASRPAARWRWATRLPGGGPFWRSQEPCAFPGGRRAPRRPAGGQEKDLFAAVWSAGTSRSSAEAPVFVERPGGRARRIAPVRLRAGRDYPAGVAQTAIGRPVPWRSTGCPDRTRGERGDGGADRLARRGRRRRWSGEPVRWHRPGCPWPQHPVAKPYGMSGPELRQEEMTGPLGTASSTTVLTVTILSQSKEYLSNTAALVIPRLTPLLTR